MKMGTKRNPGDYDCYRKAARDEPMFTILARDAHGPEAVRHWANVREAGVEHKLYPETDRALVAEARACASAMEDWRRNHKGDWR